MYQRTSSDEQFCRGYGNIMTQFITIFIIQLMNHFNFQARRNRIAN